MLPKPAQICVSNSRKAGSPGNQYDFLQQFRANNGKFFDGDMKAQLATPEGIKTLENMLAANKTMILAYHFPWPGYGYLSKQGDGFRYHAAPMEIVTIPPKKA